MGRRAAAVGARLVGRRPELDRIGAALSSVSSSGSAIHLHGEPGIGKSALLAAARGLATLGGFTVLTASGSEAESHLPFAALHQLLQPLLGDVDALPDGHRGALTRAFGLSPRSPSPEGLDRGAERFFVGLATLGLLDAAAGRAPVLLLADDVQWWDPASREIVTFLAKRIDPVPAVLLAATRDEIDGTEPDLTLGTPLRLSGLSRDQAVTVLQRHGPRLSLEDERSVLEAAAGNPLALIELPTALATPAGEPHAVLGPRSPHVLPLTSRLERAFGDRWRALGTDSRTVVLVAAALDGNLVVEVLGAASTSRAVTDAPAALEEAARSGLVRMEDAAVRFRHPLVRSAVLQLATAGERRAVHRALATALAAEPDRAAWHRALATVDPDEEVAAALHLAADHALGRGAPITAAALFERAAALSVREQRRGHRLLRAAELAHELGRADLAQRLLSETRSLVLDDGDLARRAGLEVVFDSRPGSCDDIRLIVGSAEEVEAGGDTSLAAYLLVGAARRCLWSSASDDTRRFVVDTAGRQLGRTDPRMIQITAFAEPLSRGSQVVAQLTTWAEHPLPDPATGTLLGIAGFLVGDFDRTLSFVARSLDALRQQGRVELLAQALAVQAMAGVYLGRFAEAQDAAVTACELTRTTRQPIWKALATFARAHVEAVHGHRQAAVRLTEEAEGTALWTGNHALVNRLQLARGLNALGAGDPTLAFSELRRLFDSSDPAFQRSQAVCAVDFLAESAVTGPDREEARSLLHRVEAMTSDSSAPGVRRAVALARAVLAPDEEAERRFIEAGLWAHRATPWYRARSDLAFGTWLSRQHRTIEAGRRLGSARAVFRTLEVPAWLARAEQELTALEQRREPGGSSHPEALSAQELRVARRAASGLSNQQIAEQLQLSPRTVASHLYRVFPKLGVSSRSQLHLALANLDRP